MTITVSKAVLSDAVNILSQALSKKNALPILDDFHCKVDGKTMVMTASDSEVTVCKAVVLDEVKDGGAFCMDAAMIKNALAELPEQPITLKVTDGQIVVTHETGNFHFAITHANPDEYPILLLDHDLPNLFDVDAKKVIEAINRCIWATETSDLRPAMQGICFNVFDGFLEIVASNGHHIIRSHIKANAPSELKAGFVLSKKAAIMLTKQPKDVDFFISFDDKHVLIEADDAVIYASPIDVKYPDYNKIWPVGTRPTALINRNLLINSIKKVAPFASGSSNMVRFTFSKNTLELNSEDYDFGAGATDAFNVDYDDKTIAFGIKASSLLKTLQIMKTDKLFMEFTDDSKAITLSYENPDETDQVDALHMPMLLND